MEGDELEPDLTTKDLSRTFGEEVQPPAAPEQAPREYDPAGFCHASLTVESFEDINDMPCYDAPEEDEPFEHVWVCAMANKNHDARERTEVRILRGVAYALPRFQMVIVADGKELMGRYSAYIGTRHHSSSSLAVSRRMLDAHFNAEGTIAGTYLVERAMHQMRQIKLRWNDREALARYYATSTLIIDFPDQVIMQASRPPAIWLTSWAAATIPLIDRQEWAVTGNPPLVNGKPLTKEIYYVCSNQYYKKKEMLLSKVRSPDPASRARAKTESMKRPGDAIDKEEELPGRQSASPKRQRGVAAAESIKPPEQKPSKYSSMSFESLLTLLDNRDALISKLAKEKSHIATAAQKIKDNWTRTLQEVKAEHKEQNDILTINNKHLEASVQNMKNLELGIQRDLDQARGEAADLQIRLQKSWDDKDDQTAFFEKILCDSNDQLEEADRRLREMGEVKQEVEEEVRVKEEEEAAWGGAPATKPSNKPKSDRAGPAKAESNSNQLNAAYENMHVSNQIKRCDSEISWKGTYLTVSEMLSQIGESHQAIMKALATAASKGQNIEEVKAQQAPHLEFLQDISMAFTKPWLCFPLQDLEQLRYRSMAKGARRKEVQFCAKCSESPGDWSGNHTDGSRCTAQKCELCTTLGLGKKSNGGDDCNIHPKTKCPFHKPNVPKFIEHVKRRMLNKYKDIADNQIAADFLGSFLSENGQEDEEEKEAEI